MPSKTKHYCARTKLAHGAYILLIFLLIYLKKEFIIIFSANIVGLIRNHYISYSRLRVFACPYSPVYPYGRTRVGGDPYSCIFYAVNVLISLQFFKVGKYGHAEMDVFSGLHWCEFAGGI